MLKLCMQDYKVYGVREIDHGTYTVAGTSCIEAQINRRVARVSLTPIVYSDFLANKAKYLLVTSRKGKKRKLERTDNSKLHPHKRINSNFIKHSSLLQELEKTSRSLMQQWSNNSPVASKKFNSDNVSGKRQRKPNSKFSDFITSSNYNVIDEPIRDDNLLVVSSNSPSYHRSKVMKLGKDVKSNVPKQRVKERILTLTNVDDQRKRNQESSVDPLDLHPEPNEDVVHSFLPMYEPTEVSDYEEEECVVQTTSQISEVNSEPISPTVKRAKPGRAVSQPVTVLSPKWKDSNRKSQQIYGKVICMPLVVTSNSQKGGSINIDDVSNKPLAVMNQQDQRWVQIKPKPQHTPKATTGNNKAKPLKNITSTKNITPKSNAFNKTKPTFNSPTTGSKAEPKPKIAKMLSSSRFILVESDIKYKPPKLSDIDFNKLVRSLKSVKLPAKNWKIRIIVSPQETITEVIFTNKEEIERCVKFSRVVTPGYKITFGKSEVKLLGAPTLQTFDDLAILLEIIHTIPSDSLVLEYC